MCIRRTYIRQKGMLKAIMTLQQEIGELQHELQETVQHVQFKMQHLAIGVLSAVILRKCVFHHQLLALQV